MITTTNKLCRGAMVRALCVAVGAVFTLSLTGCSPEKPSGGDDKKGGTPAASANDGKSGGKKKVVFIFKSGGGAYSEACKKGADQANSDAALNLQVEYQASPEGTAEKQADIVEQAIVSHADAIVVSPVDSKAIVPALDKAVAAGIKVFTWDADAPSSKRSYYFTAVDDVQIGVDIADALAKQINQKGKVLIFSGQSTAENLNNHVKGIEDGLKKYPGITIAPNKVFNDDDAAKATTMAVQALQANPDAAGIACANAPSPPAAAEAISKNPALKGKVKVWGLSLPSMCSKYLKDDTIAGVYLWDPQKLTYATAAMVKQVLDGKSLNTGDACGTDGKISVKDGTVTLPLRLEINKQNVDTFKF
jgi:rhamnose transport system substrate-binding protein